MLTPYFQDDAVWNEAKKILRSWKGTPYRHLCMVKGRGADCALFIASVWKELGILTAVEHDYYPRDWHVHTDDDRVRDGMTWHMQNKTAPGFQIIEPTNLDYYVRGDFMGFSTGPRPTPNHACIWCGEWPDTKQSKQMYNSINANCRGVCRITFGSWWRKRLVYILRVMKEI